jgi:hypothetical protein
MSLADSSLAAVPPDTQVAAGAGYVVEAVNVNVRIWNMNVSPPTVTDFDLISFFGLFFSDVVSDPRVRFDPVQQRWYISCVSIEETLANPPQGEFWLAVSPGSDPTQMFALYAVTTINSFPDFPHLGFNEDKLVLTGNSYSLPLSSAQFLGTDHRAGRVAILHLRRRSLYAVQGRGYRTQAWLPRRIFFGSVRCKASPAWERG